MIHYYYGHGKGKTTAAMGLALRALGRGKRVFIVQFLKDTPTGEVMLLSTQPNATILRGKAGKGFTFNMTEADRRQTRILHDEHLRKGCEAVETGQCDMLVLDEVSDAISTGLLDEAYLLAFLQRQGANAEIIMTGHAPNQQLVDMADYVSEMKKHKHPYDKGVMGRQGVEF